MNLREMLAVAREHLPTLRANGSPVTRNPVPGFIDELSDAMGSSRAGKHETLRFFIREAMQLAEDQVAMFVVFCHVRREDFVIRQLHDAAKVLRGRDRRWAINALRRIDDLGARMEAEHNDERARDFLAERHICICNAALTVEKLTKRVQSRAAQVNAALLPSESGVPREATLRN